MGQRKFKEVNEAFSVVGDPGKREQYDQFGIVGETGGIFCSLRTRTTFKDLMNGFLYLKTM
jgi:molecular chaperone DnaJ